MVEMALTWRKPRWNELCCYFFLYFLLIGSVKSFDDDGSDYELYDIVEDINENFYKLLGVDQSAEPAEIRRAYRKLSLQLHPDKNKEPDAEVKFRNLVSAYEVLKDEARRGRYNYILANGLPNWRQPVYYYRRARKMGLLEISLLLTLILTVGHFIVVWSIYFEQRFVKEEVFRSKLKRERKNRRAKGGAGSTEDEIDDKLEAVLQTIERPQLSGVLPILALKAIYYMILALPGALASFKEILKEKCFPSETEDFEEDDDEQNTGVVKRIRTKKSGPQINALPEAYDNIHNYNVSRNDNAQTDSSTENQRVRQLDSPDWTEEEFAALLKAVARIPGGTSNRWEKISEAVGRSVNDVTSRARQIKTDIVRTVAPAQQGITASRLTTVDPTRPIQADEDVSVRDDCTATMQITDNLEVTRRRRKPVKAAERTLISADALLAATAAVKRTDATTERTLEGLLWTQPQQRLLEKAMVQFPKGTDERWDRIAMLVPGKTKEDCYERYKQLVLRVKEKQTSKVVTQ